MIKYKSGTMLEINPELASEWNLSLNSHIDINKVTHGSEKMANWICSKNEGHTWIAAIKDRVQGKGCPYCSGRKVDKSNSLLTVRPDIAASWHNILNEELTSDMFTAGSQRKVWWQCIENKEHVWQSAICDRTGSRKRGCPYCTGKRVDKTNSLAFCFPNIAKEWDFSSNSSSLSPDNVSAHSGKLIWWKCSKNEEHVWRARVDSRTGSGNNCQHCSRSKGEEIIAAWLNSKSISAEPQMKFDNCKNKRILPFDFYIVDRNICIEYDGKQHHMATPWFGGQKAFERIKLHDAIKTKYCLDNNIKLIRIPFTDFNKIDEILTRELLLAPKESL